MTDETCGCGNTGTRPRPLLCPSAQPDMEGSRVLGVVGGCADTPLVSYLNEVLPVTNEVLALAGTIKPAEVFRFSAPCEERACRHFDGARCQLATRIVQILPAVTVGLPACLIRPECRWYQQEGKAACQRCPQVVTQMYEPSDEMRKAAIG